MSWLLSVVAWMEHWGLERLIEYELLVGSVANIEHNELYLKCGCLDGALRMGKAP